MRARKTHRFTALTQRPMDLQCPRFVVSARERRINWPQYRVRVGFVRGLALHDRVRGCPDPGEPMKKQASWEGAK